jgi:hypothetical protein
LPDVAGFKNQALALGSLEKFFKVSSLHTQAAFMRRPVLNIINSSIGTEVTKFSVYLKFQGI